MLKKLIIIAPISILTLSLTACSHKPKNVASKPTATVKGSSIQVKPQQKVENKSTVRTAIFKPRRNYKKRHQQHRRSHVNRRATHHGSSAFTNKLSSAALGRLRSKVRYDGSYVKIGYPWGDVPSNMGVCTDVVIRSYRKLGIDLQQQVHNDMSASFNSYPNVPKWGLSRPDPNIDHRRVYNLRAFFKRQGAALPISRNPRNYKPGDLVTWMVGPTFPHIGIVVNKPSKADPRRLMIVHNIANGPEMEDILFKFPITGHYRYTPKHMHRVNQPQSRMIASRSRRSNDKTNYQQLANDAARIMNLHGNKPNRRPDRKTNDQKLLALTKQINTPSSKAVNPKTQKIELAQAKLVDLSSAQLSDLLKK